MDRGVFYLGSDLTRKYNMKQCTAQRDPGTGRLQLSVVFNDDKMYTEYPDEMLGDSQAIVEGVKSIVKRHNDHLFMIKPKHASYYHNRQEG